MQILVLRTLLVPFQVDENGGEFDCLVGLSELDMQIGVSAESNVLVEEGLKRAEVSGARGDNPYH